MKKDPIGRNIRKRKVVLESRQFCWAKFNPTFHVPDKNWLNLDRLLRYPNTEELGQIEGKKKLSVIFPSLPFLQCDYVSRGKWMRNR